MVAINPVDQLVEIGQDTTMSCASSGTTVAVISVEWLNEGAQVVWTDSSPSKSGLIF